MQIRCTNYDWNYNRTPVLMALQSNLKLLFVAIIRRNEVLRHKKDYYISLLEIRHDLIIKHLPRQYLVIRPNLQIPLPHKAGQSAY